MALEGQDDDENKIVDGDGTGGDQDAAAAAEGAKTVAEGDHEDGEGTNADQPKPGTDKPAADGKKEGAEGEPQTTEQAIRKSLGLEEPEGAGKEGEKKAEAKPDKKGEVKPDAKKPDGKKPDAEPEKKPDLYAEPEGLKVKAKERFQELVTSHKEQTTQITAMGQTITGFRQMVKDTGATEDQFVQSLDMLKLVNTNPAEAAKKLYETALNLALAHNVEIPGVDFLKDYPDLRQQVEDQQITPEIARETAKARRDKTIRESREAREREQGEQTRLQQQEEQRTLGAIEAFLKDKETNDIDWKAKAELLLKAAQFAAKNLPVKSWLPYLQQQYEQVGEIVAKTTKPANNGGGNRPLRPNAGGGGQEQPKDMMSAIKQGLGL